MRTPILLNKPIGTRVYSENYGYGETMSMPDSYGLVMIKLDGLTINGIEMFRKGHITHCDITGQRSCSKEDSEVDFVLVEEDSND